MKLVVSFLGGLIFALGLGLSGMTQPQKVVGFLDIFGTWDPSLAFVMIGAIAFHAVAYRIIRKRESPILAAQFQVPTRKDIDGRLIIGAAMFGAGWGLAGYCPGPGITSLVTLNDSSMIFVTSMLGGMAIFHFTKPAINHLFP